MGFFDKIKDVIGGNAEDEYVEDYQNDYEEEDEQQQTQQFVPNKPQQSQPRETKPAGAGVSMSGVSLEMKVMKPDKFEAVTQIGEHLLLRRTVVLNLEDTNKETVHRIIDFLSGVVFAIDGQLKRVANSTYVITPKNVDVSSDQMREQEKNNSQQKELF